MELSVVIPTRNRRAKLEETLAALAGQGLESIEVIVVNDGSTDDTLAFLGSPPTLPFRLRILRQPPLGPAAARNRGVTAAVADRVLFLGDDTRPAPGCLEQHLAAARQVSGEIAIQGCIDWDPAREITDVMRFLAPAGPQFYFAGMIDGGSAPFTAVLGSNCSVPTRWLREEPYDEAFQDAALEDTEAAYRWRRHGWHARYAARAVAWHHHHYASIEPFLARQERAGRSAHRLIEKFPRLWWRVVGQPRAFGRWIELRGRLGAGRPTDAWDLACRAAFDRGYRAASADANPTASSA